MPYIHQSHYDNELQCRKQHDIALHTVNPAGVCWGSSKLGFPFFRDVEAELILLCNKLRVGFIIKTKFRNLVLNRLDPPTNDLDFFKFQNYLKNVNIC